MWPSTLRQDLKRTLPDATAHPVHCAVGCALAAAALRRTVARVDSLVGAALTMHAAFIDLQNELADEGYPPTKQHLQKIRALPHAAAELLRQAGLDTGRLESVTDHHERGDGRGYPRALRDMGDGATLLRLVDVYMAKVSPRRARSALSPQAAAQQMFQQRGKSAREAPMTVAVIRALGGAFPRSSLVHL